MYGPGYGYAAPPPPPQNEGLATTSMVLGILSLVVCSLLAPIALFTGITARRRIQDSGGYIGGSGMATAGIVMGAIGSALLVVAIVLIIAFVAAAGHSSG